MSSSIDRSSFSSVGNSLFLSIYLQIEYTYRIFAELEPL